MSKRRRVSKKEAMETAMVRTYRRVALREQGYRCFYCLCPLPHSHSTADHLHARARQGATSYQNIRSACQRCNQVKGATPWQDFMRWILKPLPSSSMDIWLIAFERKLWERTWEACDRIAAQVGISAVEVLLAEAQRK